MSKRLGIGIISTAFVLQSCALPQQGSAPHQQASGGDPEQVCNPLILGAAAGLGCGLISSGSSRVLTGAACAAAAVIGCYMVNSYKAQQLRTAQQVEDDYKRTNKQLPERSTLAEYVSDIDPATVSRGQTVNVSSHMKVVRGRNDPSVNVEEEIGLYDAKGEPWGKPVRKAANANGEGGEYQTSFRIPVHQGMSQGVYQIRKTVYLNGAAVSSDDKTKFQVVTIASDRVIAQTR
jgi:hypothetical protein